MKTVVIGDVHGRSLWKLIVNTENPDRIVFIGDYFDSFDINTADQLNNMLDILEYKKNSGKEVILLIGNHDHHYFPEIGYTGTSGYQRVGKFQIEPVLDTNRDQFQMAYEMDGYLFTHAGVSSVFMDNIYGTDSWNVDTVVNDLNELWKHKPLAFEFTGWDPYGDNIQQTPIWIRPGSLMKANKKHPIKKRYIQVVGHTQVDKIDLNWTDKAAGGRYIRIDAQGTSGEYLILQNGKMEIGSTK